MDFEKLFCILHFKYILRTILPSSASRWPWTPLKRRMKQRARFRSYKESEKHNFFFLSTFIMLAIVWSSRFFYSDFSRNGERKSIKTEFPYFFFVVIGCKNETNFNFRKPLDQMITTFILNVTKKSVPKDEVDFSKSCAPATKTQLLGKRIQRFIVLEKNLTRLTFNPQCRVHRVHLPVYWEIPDLPPAPLFDWFLLFFLGGSKVCLQIARKLCSRGNNSWTIKDFAESFHHDIPKTSEIKKM